VPSLGLDPADHRSGGRSVSATWPILAGAFLEQFRCPVNNEPEVRPMKRIRTIGVALAVMFVLSAGMTAAALAALPEFSAPGGFPVKLKGTGGVVKVEEIHVRCSSSTSEGEITSAKVAKKLALKLKGCTIEPLGLGLKFPCQSIGAAAEEIVTTKLQGKAVYIKEASPKEAGIDIEPESGTVLAKAECVISVSPKKTEFVTVRGSVIAKVPAKNAKSEEQYNRERTTLELKFAQEKGKQIPEVYEEEGFKTTDAPSCEIKLEEGEATSHCGMELVDNLETSASVELKA
jgi:hypothetical protein